VRDMNNKYYVKFYYDNIVIINLIRKSILTCLKKVRFNWKQLKWY